MTPSSSEHVDYIEGIVKAAQDYAIPRIDGPTHKDAGMIRHVIEAAAVVTDEMVDQVLTVFYGCEDHHFIERDGMRSALKAILR